MSKENRKIENIVFVSDQFFPRTSADSEQIVSSLSSLGNFVNVTLLSANYAFKEPATSRVLEEYYEKESTFQLRFISLLLPNVRGIEKIFFALRSAFFIRSKRFDLLYTRNIPIVVSTLLFTRSKIVFESYRPWPNRNALAHWFFKKLSNSKRFLGVVLHSKFASKSFSEVGFDDSKLLIAHNALDLKKYPKTDRLEIRNEYKLPTDKLLVTYSGRISESKGLDNFIRLAQDFPDIHFLLIGSEKKGKIELKAEQISNIDVIGWSKKRAVFALLQASDIVYIPPTLRARDVAKNTVLPLKTFLYKASGAAILAPKAEDTEEVLTHLKTAYLVEPDNYEEEKKGFSELIENSELRKRLGSSSVQEMEHLTWDNRALSILDFMNKKW